MRFDGSVFIKQNTCIITPLTTRRVAKATEYSRASARFFSPENHATTTFTYHVELSGFN